MALYRLKRGVFYHQGRRIAANSKTGSNVVELRDDHPMLKQTERWERVGDAEGAGIATGQQTTGGAPQFLPASGPAQGSTAPAHNASEVLTSETVRGGAIPGVTEPLVGEGEQQAGEQAREGGADATGNSAPSTSLGDPNDPTTHAGANDEKHDPTASPERDAVANSPLSSPQRDWYTYTIPQAVHHVRAAQDLTTLAQYKNLELAPKVGKQRGKVLEAIDERARELKG